MSAPIRLLYTEDNPQDADMLRAHFGQAASDFALEIADSGAHCLERLAAAPFDLLLIDNRLPDMEGLDVLTLLRAKGFDLPVVMVTGLGDDETVGLALRAGAADYVVKKNGYLGELPDILRAVLKRQRGSRTMFDGSARIAHNILYVEPNAMEAGLALDYFSAEEPLLRLHAVGSCVEALRLLAPGHGFDLVLTDLRVPGMNAQEFMHEALHRGIALPFIVITGRGDELSAVTVMRLGAYDYILKREGYLLRLPFAIKHALQRFYLDRANRHLYAELEALNATLERQVVQRTAELQREIEERKLAERALREQEQRLNAMLDQTPAILWTLDSGLRFTSVCGAGLQIIGQQPEQVIGKELSAYIHPHDANESLLSIAHEALRGAEGVCDTRLNDIWWQNSVKPLRDDGGEIIGVIGVSLDISARVGVRSALQRLNRLYILLSQVNEAIVRARDRDVLFNNVCDVAAQSGLFRMAWVGLLQGNTLIPVAYAGAEDGYLDELNIRLDDEHGGKGPIATAIRGATHVVCQDIADDPAMKPWREAALQRGYRSSAAFPISAEGKIVGAITVYAAEAHFFSADIVSLMLELTADISFSLDVIEDRKRGQHGEKEIRRLNTVLELRVVERTAQLELANKELEAFSYSVSHDLRAPLRSIDGFSQLLVKNHAAQLDEIGRNYLRRVSAASQRMGRLIDELLLLSRVTRSQLERRPLNLSALVAEVAAQLNENEPERKIHLIIRQDLWTHSDPGLLRVALTNLLGNAWKFTAKKAEAKIEFGMVEEDGECAYFVRDNGAGFNMTYADKLFTAFQRLHSANEFEGTGVGLATVQRIIRRHDGHVWAVAREGLGATFYFTLPQRERKE